jgi:hypothetical protein
MCPSTAEPGGQWLAAVTQAAVVKAIMLRALRAPRETVWDVDVLPCPLTELHATPQIWRLTRLARRHP